MTRIALLSPLQFLGKIIFYSLLWDRGAVLLGECLLETNFLYICGVGKLVCVHAVHVRITLKVQSE